MRKILSLFALFTVLSLFAVSAFAKENSSHITVNGVQRYFMVGKSPVQNIEVTNRSERVMVLQTIVEKRLNPGGEIGEFAPVGGNFLFAPKNFTLKPSETRMVRMVRSAQHDNDEHVYRVSFMPTKEGLKAARKKAGSEGVEMGVKMVLSTGMLVLVSPRKVKEALSYVREVDRIIFTNNGNVSIDMRRTVEHCYKTTSGEERCASLPGKRIYPGKSWIFMVEGDLDFDYHYMIYDKHGKNSPVKLDPIF